MSVEPTTTEESTTGRGHDLDTRDLDTRDLDTRDRLINAAIEVFLEKGYGGARVSDIARRAGYTAGALYVHFPSRSALLGEAIMREGNRFINEILNPLEDAVAGDGSLSRVLAEFSTTSTGSFDTLIMFALANASREPAAREMLAATLERLEDSTVRQLNVGVTAGVLDPALDVDAIRTFFSSWILGVVVHRAVQLPGAELEGMRDLILRLTRSLAPIQT